jgi:hypothetical protein
MQLRRIRYAIAPAQFDKQVEGRRERAAGFGECGRLSGRWLQSDANSSLHMYIVTYKRDFRDWNAVFAPPRMDVLRVHAARLVSSPRTEVRGLPARFYSVWCRP